MRERVKFRLLVASALCAWIAIDALLAWRGAAAFSAALNLVVAVTAYLTIWRRSGQKLKPDANEPSDGENESVLAAPVRTESLACDRAHSKHSSTPRYQPGSSATNPERRYSGIWTLSASACVKYKIVEPDSPRLTSSYFKRTSSDLSNSSSSSGPFLGIPCFSIRYLSALRLMSRYLAACV